MRYYIIGLLAVVAIVIGCNRDSGYLYYAKPSKPSDPVDITKKVKDVNSSNALDILWAIDNSGSMTTHQKNVMANTGLFMGALSKRPGLDWKMGLISSDVNDEPYLGFTAKDELNKSTKDPVGTFQKGVAALGWNRGCPEIIFEPAVKHLTKYNKFIRPTSMFVLIGVTDTAEDQPSFQKTFEDLIKKQMGSITRFKFYGILPLETTCAHESYWHMAGSLFEYFLTLTKGKAFSLCDPAFGKNLEKIGDEISTIATTSKIYLPSRPLVDTLVVSHRGITIKPGAKEDGGYWYYNIELNAVVFHDMSFAKTEKEEIRITYEVDDGRITPET